MINKAISDTSRGHGETRVDPVATGPGTGVAGIVL
jgi:hypothetical protein